MAHQVPSRCFQSADGRNPNSEPRLKTALPGLPGSYESRLSARGLLAEWTQESY